MNAVAMNPQDAGAFHVSETEHPLGGLNKETALNIKCPNPHFGLF